MTVRFSDDLLIARANQIRDARDAGGTGGKIKIYSGTKPAKGGTAGTLLAELTFPKPSSGSATGSGVLTANSIPSKDAVGSGTATWYREEDSSGSFIMDGEVGDSSAGKEIELNTTSIVVGNPVEITSYVINEANK